mgnify:CR=1 FL=1
MIVPFDETIFETGFPFFGSDDNPQLKKEPELHPETPLTGTKKRGRKRKLETPTLKIKFISFYFDI